MVFAWTCIYLFRFAATHHRVFESNRCESFLADGTAAGAEQRGCEEEQAEEEGASLESLPVPPMNSVIFVLFQSISEKNACMNEWSWGLV